MLTVQFIWFTFCVVLMKNGDQECQKLLLFLPVNERRVLVKVILF